MKSLPHDMTGVKTRIAPLMKKAWIRKLIMLPNTLSGKKHSNKTENYAAFRPSMLSTVSQTSLYVTDIERSRAFYEKIAGLTHSRTCEAEAHPYLEGYSLKCCYLDAPDQKDALILIEKRNPKGEILKASRQQIFHIAFEIEEGYSCPEFAQQLREEGFKIAYGPSRHNDLPPDGDGESGGNFAVYVYDPDHHYIEFFSDMDTIDNFQERYPS